MNNVRIKVLQYMSGGCEYFPWSEWINRRYCEKHAYEYVIRRDTPRQDRHICWHKIPIILDELHDCDYLLFLDADAVFYSHELKIEQELLPLNAGKTVLMSADCGGEYHRWCPHGANAGVMFIHVNEISKNLFNDWDAVSDTYVESRWNWPPEQLAFGHTVFPKYQDHIKVEVEYYMFQGYLGQYIRHYCTIPNERRTHEMRLIYQRLTASD